MLAKGVGVFLLILGGSLGDNRCQTLFVIDGSDAFAAFRGEIVSVSTTANIAYSSDSLQFSGNYWMYGQEDHDDPIPNYFFDSKNDFIANIQSLVSNGGSESVVGATSKLNRWKVWNSLIVLYTASSQRQIDQAGLSYTEQARTIVIHSNDGVDTSSLSIYPSPQMSDYSGIDDLIARACGNIPVPPSTTAGPSTTSNTPSPQPSTTTNLPTSTSPPETSTGSPSASTSTQQLTTSTGPLDTTQSTQSTLSEGTSTQWLLTDSTLQGSTDTPTDRSRRYSTQETSTTVWVSTQSTTSS